MATPSPAQLSFLLDLALAGGEGYAADMVRNPATLRACRTAGWVTYHPAPDPYKIGKHAITKAGLAAIDSDLRAYTKRLARRDPSEPTTDPEGKRR